jgi:peptidyl-prolyl cis-trans isomerase D
MTPAEMVRETPYIKPNDDVPNVGTSQQFEAVIQPLNNPQDVGEKTGIKGGFAIPMLVEKKDPRVPDFDEVKSTVAQTVKQQRAKDQLEQTAKNIAAAANGAGDLKAAAANTGVDVETEEGYKLGATLGKAGTSPALDEAILGLKSGEVTKTPIKVGDSWVVAGVTNRKEADLAEFASQRDQLSQSLLSERQNQVFEDYIGAVQAKMKRDGKIKIYPDVMAQLEEDEPEVVPQRPRFPTP